MRNKCVSILSVFIDYLSYSSAFKKKDSNATNDIRILSIFKILFEFYIALECKVTATNIF